MPGWPWLHGGSTTTPFGRTAAWAIYRQPITPSSAPRHRNGTGRCAQSGATRPAPLPHRAEQAQMTNRLYSSLDEKRGSGQHPRDLEAEHYPLVRLPRVLAAPSRPPLAKPQKLTRSRNVPSRKPAPVHSRRLSQSRPSRSSKNPLPWNPRSPSPKRSSGGPALAAIRGPASVAHIVIFESEHAENEWCTPPRIRWPMWSVPAADLALSGGSSDLGRDERAHRDPLSPNRPLRQSTSLRPSRSPPRNRCAFGPWSNTE
jgi:hypothetical protein